MRLLSRLLVLGVVAIVFCAPLFKNLRGVDQENDEAIYSYAAESILETGDWLNPRTSPTFDRVFLEKPPLKFWIVALPIRLGLLPDDEFGLRFWDPVFGSLAFLYVFSFARRMGGWLAGVVALLMLYTLDPLMFNHGLRGNNMEAALVLAYAGGVYHYLRWAECNRPGWARAHAAAVGFYFVLGFMTKFVAAAFLPAVLLAASLELPAVRSKAREEWRTWLTVGSGVVLVAAPWFVYQSLQPGSGLWSIMLGEHVVTRFTTSLDSAHLHPWYFYFEFLGGGLVAQGTVWLAVPGALLIHRRVLRERWLAGTLVLYWFWLPFALISLGSSKLWHYTYPFLAPVGLASGYLVATVVTAVADGIAALTDPARARQLSLPASIAGVVDKGRPCWLWIQRFLVAAALVSVAVGAISLFRPNRFRVLGAVVWPQEPARAGLTAILLGVLAGRGAWVARVALPLVALSFMPIPAYQSAVHRTGIQAHPMRRTRDCIAEVRRDEQAAGRPVTDMAIYLPGRTFSHAYFFYYRGFGWDRRDVLPDATLERLLDDSAEQRPILLPGERFRAFTRANDPPGTVRTAVQVNDDMVVALPGPYGRCAF
jgi:4-amino-4-deoxy-L-arabinose transferase-like glycosyltransferase